MYYKIIIDLNLNINIFFWFYIFYLLQIFYSFKNLHHPVIYNLKHKMNNFKGISI